MKTHPIKLAAVRLKKGRIDAAVVHLTGRRRCKLVPANQWRKGSVNGEITIYCDEKVPLTPN